MRAKKIFAVLLSTMIIWCGVIAFADGRSLKRTLVRPKCSPTRIFRSKYHWRIPQEPEKKPELRLNKKQLSRVAKIKPYQKYLQSLRNHRIASENSEKSEKNILDSADVSPSKESHELKPVPTREKFIKSNRKTPLPLSLIKRFPPDSNGPNSRISGCTFVLKIEQISSVNCRVGTLIRDDDICPFAICAISNQIHYCPELLDALLKDSEEILKLDPKLPQLVYITSNKTINLLKKYGVKILGDEKFSECENSSKN